MKKTSKILTILIMVVLLAFSIFNFYACEESENFNYELNQEGTAYSVKSIENNVYTNVVIPNEYNGLPVEKISNYAFVENKDIVKITLGENIKEIGDFAFKGCENLLEIDFNDKLLTIGEEAFSGATKIEKLNNLPTFLQTIKDKAFYNCLSLTEVSLSGNVINLGAGVFANCVKLSSITISEFNSFYKTIDGVIYTADGKEIVQYPHGLKNESFIINEDVVSIRRNAFYTDDYSVSLIYVSDMGNTKWQVADKVLPMAMRPEYRAGMLKFSNANSTWIRTK